MFGWLKRLFGIGVAEANSALDRLEDPVKMTEQGIRDLKSDLTKSLQSLAEVKAMAIRAKKELEANHRASSEYENKAILLLQKAQSGEISEAEADRLASQALAKKDELNNRATAGQKNVAHYDQMVGKMEGNVQKLKQQISSWENELKTLKARSTVSKATAKLNKQLSSVDSSDTLARLERMREKVIEQESIAESYGDIADQNSSIDDEINKALGSSALPQSESLAKLKAKMASNQNTSGDQQSTSSSSENSDNTPPENQASPGAGNSELDKLKEQLKKASDGDKS